MSRPLRIEYAGAIYHVTSRGDRREQIYLDDGDRQIWLDVLSQVCARFNWRCPVAKSLGWYEAQHEQRDSGMVSAYRSGDYTMREIADWFGVHYATVSRALKKAENA